MRILPTRGALGGVAILWDALRFKYLEVVLRSFSITVKLESKNDRAFW